MLLQACSGIVVVPHPVLLVAYELASLHEARLIVSPEAGEPTSAWFADMARDIDGLRTELVRAIDRWVSANKPTPFGAAYLHSETVGMVVDRVAEFSVAAHSALEHGVAELNRHYLWQRLTEVAIAYADLAFEIHTGVRKLPDFADVPDVTQGVEDDFSQS
jgi:hypothetical protein